MGLALVASTMAPIQTATHSPDEVRLDWSPRSRAQGDALRSLEPEFCYSGRRFGGKSNVGCFKALLYGLRYPGARVAVAREERASMETSTLLTMRSEIVPQPVWAECWREGKSTLYLPNGSEIAFFGLDKPGRALGARYGLAVVDQAEQIDYTQFQTINSCVMQVGMPWHQLMLLFNPADPEHWAYKRYSPDEGDGLRRDASGAVFARVTHVVPSDLDEFHTDATRARFNSLDGVFAERYRKGHWVAFEGSIYGDLWVPGLHVVDKPAEWERSGGYPPATWPRYRSIDFGFNHAFVCQWWAENEDGVRYRYREIYHTGRITEDHGEQILREEAKELDALREAARQDGTSGTNADYLEQLYIRTSFSDPARPDLAATLWKMGIQTYPAKNDVMSGIEAVRMALKNGPVGPRMLFVKDARVEKDPALVAKKYPTCTEEEMPGYRWQKDRPAGDKPGPRDLPIKEKDDGVDATRYMEASLLELQGVRVAA